MNVQQAGWQPGRQAGWQTSRMAGRHKEQERSQDRVSPLTGGLLFNVQKGQGKLQNGCLHLIDFGKWRKIVSKTPRQSERRPSTGQNRNWITAGGHFWPVLTRSWWREKHLPLFACCPPNAEAFYPCTLCGDELNLWVSSIMAKDWMQSLLKWKWQVPKKNTHTKRYFWKGKTL